ncbi:MAG: 3'(2'),5'-bisphosphate nucleotidase CysQ [Oscillospiraceae bacterium]|nr:3'(2'),5'-bisphosphate nucleotidase CysQ [Oscillospiraceae bacterium]
MENMENIFWHSGKVDRAAREKNMEQKGFVLWLTGPSGSGKSTIAAEVESELARMGFFAYVLDGDNLRFGINSGLGFSREDRDENIRRICEVAKLFCEAGIIAIVAAISPFEKARVLAREIIGEENFCEIYVKAKAETRKKRDPKGLYKREVVATDMPYEEPKNPEMLIDTDACSASEAAGAIIQRVFEAEIGHIAKKALETALWAAHDAGKAIMEVYKKDFSVEYKSDSSPLTEADKKANELICGQLQKYAPHIGILAEESADDKKRLKNNFCFIVDPLDGTKEFVKKNGEFTVNIALAFKNRPVMGVVHAPCLNKVWYAAKGNGAYAADLASGIPRIFDENAKIKTSGRTDGLTVVKSRSHSDEKTESLLERNKHKIKSLADVGSALKGCMIAEGDADVYYRFGYTSEWDTCAAQCIVEESGGIFLQGDYSEMTYNRENTLNEKGFIILNRMESKLD